MLLVSLVYVSTASHPMSDEELMTILKHAREKNQRLDVTGMLLYRDGFFIQALEGERAVVDSLYATIAADPRHMRVLKVMESTINHRVFSNWSMGFNKFTEQDLKKIEGYKEYEQLGLERMLADHPSRALKLLLSFVDQMYF
jgi:hypothetical protein